MKRKFAAAIIFSSLLALTGSLPAAQYGVNLLANGNAEQGSSSSTGAPVAVPGWTTSNALSVVPYNAPGGFPTASSGPTDGMNQFFAGGNGVASSSASQDIDVTANAADIDTGKVVCDFSGWFGGFADQDDQATLTVTFKKNEVTLSAGTIGAVTAVDRNNSTKLLPRGTSISIPAGTQTINVLLLLTRKSAVGSFNDGYADSLRLVLRGPGLVTTPADSGPGSLRDIIPIASSISFDPAVFPSNGIAKTIDLLTGLPPITNTTTIVGPGAKNLTIRRSATVPANNLFSLFTIAPATGTTALVSYVGLTFANGSADLGGAINCSGDLSIEACVFTGNMSSPRQDGYAAVINCSGDLAIKNSLFTGNKGSVEGGYRRNVQLVGSTFANNDGTIIDGSSNMTAQNCTFSGNGGAIAVGPSLDGPLVGSVNSCTFTGNSHAIILYSDLPVNDVTMTVTNSVFQSTTTSFFFDATGLRFVSGGYNLSAQNDTNILNGIGDRNNTDPMLGPLQDNGGPTLTCALLPGSLAIDKGNSNLTTDQRGLPRQVDDPNSINGSGNKSDIGAFEFQAGAEPTPSATPTPAPTATPSAAPGLVGNVSTRLPVGTGDNVLIEGFIVQGPGGSIKKVMVRAIGPSLVPFGIVDAMANPILEIHDSSGALVAMNNDWKVSQTGGLITGDQAAEINASGLAPGNDLESAIIANLTPGNFTAVVRGFGNTSGTGVVDAYDLSTSSQAKLANIATRGLVQPGDKLLIGGFIIQSGAIRVVIRATGPSLAAFGINNALPDTTLQLRDQNGNILLENDDWKTSQQQELQSTGLQPSHDLESALVTTISPGQYTAQVRGKNNSSGIGVVEVYFLQ